MANIVGVVVNVVSCICSAPTCNCVGHINFDDDVDELKRNLEYLNNRKQDIESRMLEVGPGQVVKQEVQNWCQNVQEINADVQALLEKVQRVRWYNKRASLHKLVCKKINVVKVIHEQGGFTKGLVIERATADRGLIIPAEYTVGEISTKEEIWGYLMGNQVGMIGVIGMNGVGKTTIMKHIHNDLLKVNKFDKVIWITVSYPLNIYELQKRIARVMGERLPEELDQMWQAAELMKIMKRVRYVLILDDVWETFSLKDVGIPEPSKDNGCKVVITSNSADVCNCLGCKIVRVQCLSPEDSLNLFLDVVGHAVVQVPQLKEISKLIVEECAGLPLAIVVIAASMRGVDDIAVWIAALNELRKCGESVKFNWNLEQIFMALRFSYDRLRCLEVKLCFLYCSLFPGDYMFSKRELIEGWIDEGLIDGLGSRQPAYDRGHAFLNRLEGNCLLEKAVSGDDNNVVKMQALVRDMAIIITSELGYMSRAGRQLSEVPDESEWVKDLEEMSLMMNDISNIPHNLSPKCPILSTLNLSKNPLQEIPESFFENMLGLKVLDLSETRIVILPNSISNLENLTALLLRSCKRLKYVPCLAKLKALKKLDLKGAGIEVVPQGMQMLTSLEYLDLFCDNLKELPTGILSNLSHLQFLCVYLKAPVASIGRSFYMQDFNFFFHWQDFNYFIQSKVFQNLTAYRFFVQGDNEDLITKDFYPIDDLCVLLISDCDIEGESIEPPNNLLDLRIYRSKNLRGSLNKTVLLETAIELNRCTILDCEEMEFVLDFVSSFSSFCPVLNKLENLKLCGLPNLCALVRVVGGPAPPGIFSHLRRLIIRRCPKIRTLFPLELLQALQTLEEIRVRDCKQMEEIIASDVSVEFTLSKLRQLYLVDLPQLESICSAKGAMVCNSIEVMVIIRCPNLKSI